MFYYSWPRSAVVGEYQGTKVVGTAWMDHEYSLDGLGSQETKDTGDPGWRWFSMVTCGPTALEVSISQVCHACHASSSRHD